MTLRPSFFPWLILVFFITNLVHEGCHWLMGAALGFEMRFGLNTVSYLSPSEPWQRVLADIAGPIVTIAQGLSAYIVVMRGASSKIFAFLYAAFFMRLVAGLVSVMHPNDEARVSMFLGIGKWTLPILVAAGLLVLAVRASRRLKLNWKDQLACYVVASVTVSVIVGLDRALR
ncbi:hypothetical protein [uncultured Massilia sp.]|uniref:hypothetical protein n=1 Tax=uncultured Massilia sp. TaxID=169973 RepID=UPI0025882F32|nr:hypothetical protein [uncultured Massilia sp.]